MAGPILIPVNYLRFRDVSYHWYFWLQRNSTIIHSKHFHCFS